WPDAAPLARAADEGRSRRRGDVDAAGLTVAAQRRVDELAMILRREPRRPGRCRAVVLQGESFELVAPDHHAVAAVVAHGHVRALHAHDIRAEPVQIAGG